MNIRDHFMDGDWSGFHVSRPSHRDSIVKVTSFEERAEDPAELSSSSSTGSFSSHIEIKGIRPKPVSQRTRAMLSDPFFEVPRILPRPRNVTTSFSDRSSRLPFESSGYGSGSSFSSMFEDQRLDNQPQPSVRDQPNRTEVARATLSRLVSHQQDISDKKDSMKEKLIRALDELDARVSFLRETANELQDEKQKLLQALQSIEKHKQLQLIEQIDREEVLMNANRLIMTLDTVAVGVVTRRNAEQESALESVVQILDSLQQQMHNGLPAESVDALSRVRILLNTCLSEADARVAIDEKFQKLVIACAADDQKRVRKKLENMVRAADTSESKSSIP